ncbi:CBS domain protein [Streptomyces caelestis]|uniref:CBS domain protein n=2 Tax=Streptomyces TaxID=1883 RepID=A0A0M8QUR2_9ACTN|nr:MULTISPECIES: CBS domain-containing protein [Streptomyces]KOT42683.1 CBS domain protein [Streptomyces caelestis]KOV35602.1 CBS domain protein [Streptomyces sp. XY152]
MRNQKVGSVMTTDVVRAEYGTPFKAVARLLAEHRVGGLPVVDDDEHVIGVVSETDLMLHQAAAPLAHEPSPRLRIARLTPRARRWAAKARARTAGGLMTAPAVGVHAEDTVVEAARTMARHRVNRLPVLDEEDRLAGIVTRHDLLRTFLRPDAEIRGEVIRDVLERGLWLVTGSIDVTVTEGVVTLDGRMERKSETEIAVAMTRRTDGVVDVVNRLTHRFDDSGFQNGTRVPGDVADDRLRRL